MHRAGFLRGHGRGEPLASGKGLGGAMRRGPCFIVPPHIIESIARNGSSRQKARAFAAIAASERIRGRREALGLLPRGLHPACAEKQRTVFDAQNRTQPPYRLARREGARPTKDVAVNEAFDGAGSTFDLFEKAFERCSIDGRGLALQSVVHFATFFDNAFWDGAQMVYGDGDGDLFGRFTASVDVIGHELTHGVTQYEAGLEYYGQPGALNESFSDVFGSLVRQRLLGQAADEADWLIGAALLTKNVEGVALRSMKAPGTAYDDDVLGKDPQPAHMRDFVKTTKDNGGVHINSGIANRAFFEAATRIGGRAWEKPGRIWYEALNEGLKPHSSFADAARVTAAAARKLYGAGGKEEKAVTAAWKAVGVRPATR